MGSTFGDHPNMSSVWEEGESSSGRRRRRVEEEDLGDGVEGRSVRRRISGVASDQARESSPIVEEATAEEPFWVCLSAEVAPPENQVLVEYDFLSGLEAARDDNEVLVEPDFLRWFEAGEAEAEDYEPDFRRWFEADEAVAGDNNAEDIDPYAGMRMDVDNMPYEGLLSLEERMGQVKPKIKFSEAEAKGRIREVTLLSDEEPETCTICLDGYKEMDRMGFLQCGHFYHHDCLVKWLQTNAVCPLCRQEPLPF